MSKCRAKNPQKCYYHSAMGRFVFRLAKIKTHASDEQIKQTMSELNKEGRSLPNPNQKDVENWIDGRELATQYDPDLDNKERTIQMNHLNQAREDIKEGVSGARFHMWKNLVGRLKSNMGKKIAVFAIGGALVIGLGACTSAGGGNAPTNHPTSSTSQSASPTSPATTAPAGNYGDVVGLKSVTDKYGTYEQTTISPKAAAMTLDKTVVTPGASSTWSDADLQSAQQFVVKFTTEEGIDSTAVDNRDAWSAWQNANKNYFAADQYDSLVIQPDSSGADRSMIIDNDFILKGSKDPYNPVFVRDGKPRLDNEAVKVTAIDGGVYNNNKYVDVTVTAKTVYRVSSANAYKYLQELGQGNIASDKLKSGKGEVTFITDSTFRYEIIKQGNDWKITGSQNSYNGYAGSGWSNIPTVAPTAGTK